MPNTYSSSGGGPQSVFDMFRNHRGGFDALPNDGSQDVFNIDSPYKGLSRSADQFYGSSNPDMLSGIQKNFGSVDASPLGRYISSQADNAQNLFRVAAALGNQSTLPGAWQNFSQGFINGLLGQGQPTPFIRSNNVGNIMSDMSKLFGGSSIADLAKNNTTAAELQQTIANNPASIVDLIMSVVDPSGSSMSNALRQYLEGQTAQYLKTPVADRSAHANDFISAMFGNVGGYAQ